MPVWHLQPSINLGPGTGGNGQFMTVIAVQNADYDAAAGQIVPVNRQLGGPDVTVRLPAAPSDGDRVGVVIAGFAGVPPASPGRIIVDGNGNTMERTGLYGWNGTFYTTGATSELFGGASSSNTDRDGTGNLWIWIWDAVTSEWRIFARSPLMHNIGPTFDSAGALFDDTAPGLSYTLGVGSTFRDGAIDVLIRASQVGAAASSVWKGCITVSRGGIPPALLGDNIVRIDDSGGGAAGISGFAISVLATPDEEIVIDLLGTNSGNSYRINWLVHTLPQIGGAGGGGPS